MILFYSLIILIIIQRIIELRISNRNEKWLLKNGGLEYGAEHYKFIVLLHLLFFFSMIIEFNWYGKNYELGIINYLFLVFFFFLQGMRVWILRSLGKYWNTKILRISGSKLVKVGPYKYFKHPNYVLVACEIFTLPMIFNLYYTAIIFSILNAVMLSVRIKVENEALKIQ